jgi:pimeloyl-ACP methyl ester carboxylesterase
VSLALIVLACATALNHIRVANRKDFKANHARLIQDNYNKTFSYSYGRRRGPKGETLRFLVPASSEREFDVRVFNRSVFGPAGVEMIGPDGRPVFSAHGRTLSLERHLRLSAGLYGIVVELGRAYDGILEIGFKGQAVWIRDLDPGHFTKIDPVAEQNFHWPYFLFVPDKVLPHPTLLVIPNNTGFVDDDVRIHEESAKNDIFRFSEMAETLAVPLLVPAFPRPASRANVYTHALDRDALTCREKDIARPDLQLAEMIDDALRRLQGRGMAAAPRVFLFGFSASAMFANRFTILHPERVAAAACGAPGGWPIAPAEEFRGKVLPYPVGLAGLKELTGETPNPDLIRKVPMVMFMGGHDENDSVVYRDGYELSDEELISALFGADPQSRWKPAENLYRSAGMDCRFLLYPAAGHELTQDMKRDVVAFFAAELAKDH